VYRTGDRAQRLQDGRIRIVGRCDFEVKVHGFRVNLNDVEAMVERLPGVWRAVVVASSADTHPRLFAFVLPRASCDPPDGTMMRAALAEQVPSYMVPSQIRLVTTFPLLPNGKVDRVALTISDSDDVRSGDSATDDYVAPRTVTERVLAGIWQSLLGVSRVSATDDFFALGGDSLDATRFILRAEDAGVSVTPEQLEDAPSLTALARAIDEEARQPVQSLQTEQGGR
jgi:acyl carrier protein